jgi:hypothetical protein
MRFGFWNAKGEARERAQLGRLREDQAMESRGQKEDIQKILAKQQRKKR